MPINENTDNSSEILDEINAKKDGDVNSILQTPIEYILKYDEVEFEKPIQETPSNIITETPQTPIVEKLGFWDKIKKIFSNGK